MTDRNLARALEELSAEIEFPVTPALHRSVRESLERQPSGRIPWAPQRRRFAIALAFVAALVATFTFSAPAREALADFLGVLGIEIKVESDEPKDLPGPKLDDLNLGERVSAGEAQDSVGFPLRGPRVSGEDRSFFFDRTIGAGGMVSTVLTSPGGGRLLITEFRADLDEAFLKKIVNVGATVDVVEIAGTEGYWIGGPPHVIGYVDRDGVVRSETRRLAGRALIWDIGGLTYRIEGASTVREALSIAAEMGF